MATQAGITVGVKIEDRRFAVTFDREGKPVRITERVWKQRTSYHGAFTNLPYWHGKFHAIGGINTLPARAIFEACKVLWA